eukprot:6101719-Amphidinium_carterae.1
MSPNFEADEDEGMETSEEGEPEGEEGLDDETEEHDNPPPGNRLEAPTAMVTAREHELEDRATVKVEPSLERGTPGPQREPPHREHIGPKRKAPGPPRDPDDNQPKRPAHAPVNRPEPDAEPADRGNRRPVPPGGNPRRRPMPPLSQRNLDLLQQCYDPIQDG